MREVALGDKHHLRKHSDWKAQISPISGTNAFLICAFRSADFLKWWLAQPHAQSLFLFPIVLVLIWFIFAMRRKTVQPEIRSFVSLLRSHVTPFDRGKPIAKSAKFTKNANCFEECNVFGNGKCDSSPFKRAETEVQTFGKEKCKTHRQFQRFGKEKCKLLRRLQRYQGDVPSVSLFLYISLSLSHRAHLMHNIGSTSALPIIESLGEGVGKRWCQ